MDASNVVNVFVVVLSYLEKPDVPILLEKLVVPIFQTEGFDFAGKIGCSGLPNQTAWFWQTEHMILFNLIVVNLLSYAPRTTCSHILLLHLSDA
jgi:hypothetical protein